MVHNFFLSFVPYIGHSVFLSMKRQRACLLDFSPIDKDQDRATLGDRSLLQLSLLERKNSLPIGFHARHRPAPPIRLVERFIEPADVGPAVVGPLALGIGVMHQAHETRAATG